MNEQEKRESELIVPEQPDLKIKPKSKTTGFKMLEKQEPAIEPKEEAVTSKDAVKVFFTLLFGYLVYAIIPTLVFMKALDFGFWLSSGLTFGLAVVLVFALGLHKPASAEQLAKRDMNRRKKKSNT